MVVGEIYHFCSCPNNQGKASSVEMSDKVTWQRPGCISLIKGVIKRIGDSLSGHHTEECSRGLQRLKAIPQSSPKNALQFPSAYVFSDLSKARMEGKTRKVGKLQISVQRSDQPISLLETISN